MPPDFFEHLSTRIAIQGLFALHTNSDSIFVIVEEKVLGKGTGTICKIEEHSWEDIHLNDVHLP